MMKTTLLFICALLLLVACSPGIEVVAPYSNPISDTSTPEPTYTPEPLVDFSGSLFFDYNGSGLREEGEPPVDGFKVCAKTEQKDRTCTQTDATGAFTFEDYGVSGEYVSIRLEDPNSSDPALAFRYINKWKESVTIDAYEFNGIQVPEQHLQDTTALPIDEELTYTLGDDIELGLMQGFLTLPFIETEVPQYKIWNYFDILGNRILNDGTTYGDTRDNRRSNYDGRFTSEATPDDLRRLMNFEYIPGVGDSHTGLDFLVPVGNYIVSGAPTSRVWNNTDPDKTHLMFRDPDNPDLYFESVYAHMETGLVDLDQDVYRGQIVGLSGDYASDGWNIPQLHYHLAKALPEGWYYIDTFRCTIDFDEKPVNYWGSDVSWWTKDNDPQYSAATISFIRLGSPFASDCGDGIPRIWSNDSFNGPGLAHAFDEHHGHVDIFVPAGCDVNSFDLEVVAPAAGTLIGDGDSYQLWLPKDILLYGTEAALVFTGEENIEIDKVTNIRLDFGHIDTEGDTKTGIIGEFANGQPFAEIVPYGDQQKLAYQIWLDYNGKTYMLSPTLFEQEGPEWVCVPGSQYDCEPESHDYAP